MSIYTLIVLAGSGGPDGAVASILRGLANSMDGSDGLFEPLVAEETNPAVLPPFSVYQPQNKPISLQEN